jgi:hypothetical protein
MTVKDVFFVRDRGVIVTGGVEIGTLRPDDLVEIHGHGPVKAILVYKIEAYQKELVQTSAGDVVGLVLGDIGKKDIQRGDVLLAGGADPGILRGDVPPAGGNDSGTAPLGFESKMWERLPKRRKPLTGGRELIGPIGWILAGIAIAAFAIPVTLPWYGAAFVVAVGGALAVKGGADIYRLVRARQALQRGRAAATAMILGKIAAFLWTAAALVVSRIFV